MLPKEDQILFADDLAWHQGALFSAELDLTQVDTVFAGARSMRVAARGFTVEFLPPAPVAITGYTALRLAFHPGDAVAGFRPSFALVVNGDADNPLQLIDQLDLEADRWQTVDVPLDQAPFDGAIESLRLLGSLRGTFYLDEIRLVAARPPLGPTAVREEIQDGLPRIFALSPNFPNPFNRSTILRYRIGKPGRVQLEVFDLQGQKIMTLVDRDATPGYYELEWDGTDADGRQAATGVYLLRLRAQSAVRVQKMLLLK